MDECSKCMKHFCVMCGLISIPKQMLQFSGSIHENRFIECFKVSKEVFNNRWVPKLICGTCASRLRRWKSRKHKMYISSPAI